MGQSAPYDVRMPGEKVERNTFVIRRRRNKVHIPPELEGALKNHIFTKARDEDGNEINAYVEVEYVHQEFPKLLYHPNWGQKPMPKVEQYVGRASTPEQHQEAFEAFSAAMAKWQRENRTKLVQDAKEEKRLLGKGWLAKAPERPIAPGSVDDDEL